MESKDLYGKLVEIAKYIIFNYNKTLKRKLRREKLSNILYLVDMDYFKHNKKTITACTYLKSVCGVIGIDSDRNNISLLVKKMDEDIIEDYEVFLGIVKVYYSCKPLKLEFLSDDELKCINGVLSDVMKMTDKEFRDVMENDFARRATKVYETIDPYLVFYR